jgi:alpha-L-fucosidase
LYEWFNPLWKKDHQQFATQHTWPQMLDLVNTYKPDVFWTDGDWDESDTTWQSTKFLAWLYNESPVKNSVVTFDRWGRGITV